MDENSNLNGGTGDTDVNNPKFNEAGKNVRKAINDAQQALQIARTLEYADRKRDFERARVLAAFNGAAPYSETEMLASAQSYRFNLSFGFMEGAIGRATVPYNQLVGDTRYIANIEGDLSEAKLAIIRDELTDIVKEWGKWQKMLSRLIQDLVLYGYNTAIFPTLYNPWPIFVPQKEGFVHELTPNDVGELELFVWQKSYMIHELYNNIADEDAARKAGWNVENVRKALENAAAEQIYDRQRGGGWQDIESAIRGGTLYTSMVGAKQIDTFHVFAAELDGDVTHYVVDNTRAGGSGSISDKNPNAELFRKEKRFRGMKDVVVYFDLEAGDGKWQGSRGLGRRSFNTHLSIDKLRCGLLDQSFVSGLTLLQCADQTSQEDFTLTVAGPFAVIPAGVSISNTSIPTLPATSFQMDALLSATAEQRFGDIVPDATSTYRRGEKTATQAEIDANRSAMVTKGSLQRFLDPLSQMVSLIVHRLLKENSPNPYAQQFQKSLKEKGFTPEDFKKIRRAQSTGKISTVLGRDAAAMQVVFAEFRGDPDIDQKELKRRRLASVVGPKEVDGLLIEGTDPTIKIEATRQQMEEIGTILGGITVPVSPRDMHEIHLVVAMDWLMGQIEAQKGGNPGAPLEVLAAVGQHAEGHIAELAKDPSMKKQVAEHVRNFKVIADELRTLKPPQPPSLTPTGGTGNPAPALQPAIA